MKNFFRVPSISLCSFSLICAMLAMAKASSGVLFGGAYIIPHFEGSCLYFSTFPDIFILAFIGFSRYDPHYSCGKFELPRVQVIIMFLYFSCDSIWKYAAVNMAGEFQ
jgi:hypothetical protein